MIKKTGCCIMLSGCVPHRGRERRNWDVGNSIERSGWIPPTAPFFIYLYIFFFLSDAQAIYAAFATVYIPLLLSEEIVYRTRFDLLRLRKKKMSFRFDPVCVAFGAFLSPIENIAASVLIVQMTWRIQTKKCWYSTPGKMQFLLKTNRKGFLFSSLRRKSWRRLGLTSNGKEAIGKRGGWVTVALHLL